MAIVKTEEVKGRLCKVSKYTDCSFLCSVWWKKDYYCKKFDVEIRNTKGDYGIRCKSCRDFDKKESGNGRHK